MHSEISMLEASYVITFLLSSGKTNVRVHSGVSNRKLIGILPSAIGCIQGSGSSGY